ncbi:MAG: cytochrome c3 family protein [Deltaproteobacteria bacterium]|nr:cytochrome c3 family protein [Deltaproteobacteria bacterium]
MKPFLIGLAIGTAVLFLFINFGSSFRSEQPISFNHKKHQEQGVECAACHSHFKEQTFSGMPKVAVCMECHKDSITKHPDEEKIRQFQKMGEEIPWRRVYQQPDDVFFSHRRHVVLAKMECKACHGDIGQSEKPPAKPSVKMTMKWCMDCHTKTKANNDCLVCHV